MYINVLNMCVPAISRLFSDTDRLLSYAFSNLDDVRPHSPTNLTGTDPNPPPDLLGHKARLHRRAGPRRRRAKQQAAGGRRDRGAVALRQHLRAGAGEPAAPEARGGKGRAEAERGGAGADGEGLLCEY